MYIRILVVALLIILLATLMKFIMNPKRKLHKAQMNGTLYFLDDQKNVRNNFFITYKGLLFQGEKYTDKQNQKEEVQSIFIWSDSSSESHQLHPEERHLLEKTIRSSYPKAQIHWKSFNEDD
ncbi:MAG: sigma-w pathway protein ysdB [Bacillus sp. (in: firmicutes)]